MLVLSRKKDEEVVLKVPGPDGHEIEINVTVMQIRGDKVRIGFQAPQSVVIARREILGDGDCYSTFTNEE